LSREQLPKNEGYVPNSDAYWEVRSIDYVPEGPVLETSLFDDPVRLDETWRRALETMEAQNEWVDSLSSEEREAFFARVAALGSSGTNPEQLS
jgi:hypothetical protein